MRGGNDFVISLISQTNANRVGELTGLLLRQYQLLNRSELRVVVSATLQCMLGNKSRMVNIEESNVGSFPAFSKGSKRSELVYTWPSSMNKELAPPPQTTIHRQAPAPPSRPHGANGYGNGHIKTNGHNVNRHSNGVHTYGNL
ncbi:hypothetical protein SK128_028553 [Halocaridina rubra]|uniref:Uncharacterized protein n=1 Tax=Halocaridina rubra TaxID=373956 RepID=A0AAN8ZVC3_HALRR